MNKGPIQHVRINPQDAKERTENAFHLCARSPLCGVFLFFLIGSLASAQSPTNSAGLDALSDDALYAELARLGQTTLLDRAFEINHVSPEKRQAIAALLAMAKLKADAPTLTPSQRADLLNQIAAGAASGLRQMNDPKALMEEANALIQYGLLSGGAANTLEYWGENTSAQAKLRPIAETVLAVLARCTELAKVRADSIANSMKAEDEQKAGEWMEADKLARTAEFTAQMCRYYLALSMDRADPKRKSIADEAIAYLKQFDDPDSSVQPAVRVRIGKLDLVKGDYAAADQTLTSVVRDDSIVPKPSLDQQYEARYFSITAALLAGELDTAKDRLDDLRQWQESNLPASNQSWLAGAKAAASVMEYRILSARAQKSRDDDQRRPLNDKATAVLLDLLKQRPEYRGVIYEQLADKLPDQVDVARLDPLLLEAVVYRGELQRLKPAASGVNTTQLEQAIAAANELVARQKRGEVSSEVADNAALLIGFFDQKLGHEIDAAEAFVDYVEHHRANLKNARLALDNALAAVGKRRKETPNDPRVRNLYERLLPIAIAAPFERKEFTYEYGRILLESGRSAQAAQVLNQVPADDPRKLEANLLRAVALKGEIEKSKKATQASPPQEREKEIDALCDQVRVGARSRLASATDENSRLRFRSILVKTMLLDADIANNLERDPQRCLRLLEGFEDAIKGLPGESQLLGEALYLRTDSYMDLHRDTDATAALVALLKGQEGSKGAEIIYNLLQRLDKDLDAAKAAGDHDQMQQLARSRAVLSGYLVQWAATNTDPRIRQFTYRYRVFDAGTQLLAAQLETDPQQRQKDLTKALEKYQSFSVHSAHFARAGSPCHRETVLVLQ